MLYQEAGSDNLCELPYSDAERVVGYMRTRFHHDKMYTWAGNVLLCVRTYKDGGGSFVGHRHQCDGAGDNSDGSADQPSMEAVVDRACFRLRHNIAGWRAAGIIVSGESGAGKTYSTCLAIKSIANRAGAGGAEGEAGDGGILWQVWASVPLLCAFGNAPTCLNTNSSRFGKLLRLQYSRGELRGAMVDTYLIEKSRVAAINCGEGNFHIFRQILDSLPPDVLTNLRLNRNIEYRIAPKVGLKSTYTETVKSLEVLHLNDDVDNILIVLSVILNLGNLSFVPAPTSPGEENNGERGFIVRPDGQEFVENAALLLHVPPFLLCDLLCNVQFTSVTTGARRQSIYKSPCTDRRECEARRDAIMKLLYERLFRWLVNAINFRIQFLGDPDEHINILDLYGFEVFEQNGFEQLCINYANERLQQYFCKRYLVDERTALLADGFEVDALTDDVMAYQERIGLIDGPISIFGILNEECVMKRFKSDLYVTQRLRQTLRQHARHFFVVDEMATLFTIRHFAGCVKYEAARMVAKNRDKCPEDIVKFMRMCDVPFVHMLLPPVQQQQVTSNRRTVLTYFKKSFDDLIGIFDSCDVHYVKCLKPNGYRLAEFFDDEFFVHQMATNGVFDILKLSFQNYSIKMTIDKFSSEMGALLLDTLKRSRLSDEMHVGKRHIFMQQGTYAIFQRFAERRRQCAVKRIQRCWRRRRHNAAVIIQSLVRHYLGQQQRHLADGCVVKSNAAKIENYLRTNRVECNFEGAPLSLTLERVYNQIVTKKFKRVLFCGDRIISYNKLAEIAVRFHLNTTCIRYSHLLPKSELPQGLIDIF